MWSGPCLGGPLDTREGISRFPQGFLLVDREASRVWIYDLIGFSESPTGRAFQVRMQAGELLISDPGAPKNRYRAADEAEFDIRTVDWMPGFGDEVDVLGDFRPSPYEAAFDTAVYAGRYDLAMSDLDMIEATRRWMKVWSDSRDPRRVYFEGFTGWRGYGRPRLWRFPDNSVEVISNDHEWHQRIHVRPEWEDEPEVNDAIVSISRGEYKQQWMLR